MIMLPNFSYLIDDKLAGSAHPGYGASLQKVARELAGNGFTGVISLTEAELDGDILSAAGLEPRHIPILDFSPPSEAQIREMVEFIDRHDKAGGRVLVHCAAGYGRTGTMLAGYLVSRGMSADRAIATVRTRRPGSIEVAEQEEAVRAYERSRGAKKKKTADVPHARTQKHGIMPEPNAAKKSEFVTHVKTMIGLLIVWAGFYLVVLANQISDTRHPAGEPAAPQAAAGPVESAAP